MTNRAILFFVFSFLFSCSLIFAQDRRAQYPGALSKAFFGVNLGYIQYPFSNVHLRPGFEAESVSIPHGGLRITLFGYQINEHLSARITYMRPFTWVHYNRINNDTAIHSVWMNVGGLTLNGRLPLTQKLSLTGEAGLGVVTRNGFVVSDTSVVDDVSFASALLGAGLNYQLNKKWSLNLEMVYSPERKNHRQPSTKFFSGGFTYHMQPLTEQQVRRNTSSGYIFPEHLVQVGYTTNGLGYGVNKLVSEGPVPIFWGGDAVLRRGVSVNYQRNVFHTRKVFSLDVGASFGYWQTRSRRQEFYSLSVYPLLRFTPIRTRDLDVYLNYSVAGPSYISRVELDGEDTGRKFTFRDFMGMGIYAGKSRKLNAEINIGHFSNGNIFPSNAGVKIPLCFNVGYCF